LRAGATSIINAHSAFRNPTINAMALNVGLAIAKPTYAFFADNLGYLDG